MKVELDFTHDVNKRSFLVSANDGITDFPIQNLPLGVFSTAGKSPRLGVAIGDQIFDLKVASQLDLLPQGIPKEAFHGDSLNALFALGQGALRNLRGRLSELLDSGSSSQVVRDKSDELLVSASSALMHRPTAIGNYTDFYAGIYHARAAGALLTPENPLPENYKWVPIAYHGRASSVHVGGTKVHRPKGQQPPLAIGSPPSFGPSDRLDFELELGFYVCAGNMQGHPIPISNASANIAGFSLLNDWSARDIQRWEMFPLGPFLSKSFATSVAPWVVTPDALAPFRVPAMVRPEGDPTPLSYLRDEVDTSFGALNIDLQVQISTEKMRSEGVAPVQILTSNARHLYWTPAQMVAHHTINGCNLMPGDLIGSGTISGPATDELGSMLELTGGGVNPVVLPNGERRSFLLDGDEVTLRGRCDREGFVSIGFGTCSNLII